jgi:hypothetical protein
LIVLPEDVYMAIAASPFIKERFCAASEETQAGAEAGGRLSTPFR